MCGDGGPATQASLTTPLGVAVDGSGNIFIADTGDNKIREVSAATGNITTFAFTGATGFSGDGGSATLATMTQPFAVKVDTAGNVYIGGGYDMFIFGLGGGYEVVREVIGGVIETVAGQDANPSVFGFAGDGGPATSAVLNNLGLVPDGAGGFYIADYGNNRVRKVSP